MRRLLAFVFKLRMVAFVLDPRLRCMHIVDVEAVVSVWWLDATVLSVKHLWHDL
jgi:hypothetical protein